MTDREYVMGQAAKIDAHALEYRMAIHRAYLAGREAGERGFEAGRLREENEKLKAELVRLRQLERDVEDYRGLLEQRRIELERGGGVTLEELREEVEKEILGSPVPAEDGRRCERCGGSGKRQYYHIAAGSLQLVDCVTCSGTGRAGGKEES